MHLSRYTRESSNAISSSLPSKQVPSSLIVTSFALKVLVTKLVITSDRAGKHIIDEISTDNIVENRVINVYRNDFYLHYPSISTSLIGFGL
jgi:hypothetical protein